MSALDHLLTAADPFVLFGLERKFDVNLVQLDQRHTALHQQVKALESADPDKAGRALTELEFARKTLADPVARGRLLLDLLGGAADPQTDALPPGFREQLQTGTRQQHREYEETGRCRDWAAGERRRLISAASNLFRLLGSADNGVVQRARRQQVRATLNAMEQLDPRRSL